MSFAINIADDIFKLYPFRMQRLFIVMILIFVELLFGSASIAQNEALDSLNTVLNLTMDKAQRMKTLNLIALKLRSEDPARSKKAMEEALEMARKLHDKKEIALALSTKGFLLNASNNYSLALKSYQEALDIYKETENDLEAAEIYYRIGSIYKTLGIYERSIENCLLGLKIYERLDDKKGIALIYRVMGSIYKYKGDYKKSLFYYAHGLKINQETGSLSQIANSYNNIGIVYSLMNDFKKALSYYKKSLSINLAQKIESEATINYGNIGSAYLEMDQMDSAYHYISKYYIEAQQHEGKKGRTISLQAFGDYYLKKNEYSKAAVFYKKALTLSREIGILETSRSILKSLTSLYESDTDYRNAFTYYKLYNNLSDSILNSETLQRIEQMDMEYSIEKEKNKHELKDEKSRLYRIIGFTGLLFLIFILLIIYYGQNLKLKRKSLEQKNLELNKKQLQYEILYKDKELFNKAIHLAEQNEFIGDITNRLNDIIIRPGEEPNALKTIIKELKFHSESHTWEEFELTFLKVHPDFFISLNKKFPDLTANEKRLCAFLKLNFSTKEISNITHQSFHSLIVARTRLRKKLGLSNSGDNLTSFLGRH